jgi:hypothetical protein
MKLDIDWLKANHQMIHYFGLGFIQLKLDQTNRVHFYTSELPPIVDDEDIHNHRYDFTSKIISGKITNYLYSEIEGDTHFKSDESCKEGMNSETLQACCGVLLTSIHTYVAGSEYFVDHNTFHRVAATDCVTWVIRSGYKKEYAQVIRPMNSVKVCPFGKKLPDDKLWEIVESICLSIGKNDTTSLQS